MNGKKKYHKESTVLLAGQMTTSAVIDTKGKIGTIGIMLNAMKAYRFFLIFSLTEVRNSVFDFEEIFDQEGRNLQQQIANEVTISGKVRLVETFFLKQLQKKNTTLTSSMIITMTNRIS